MTLTKSNPERPSRRKRIVIAKPGLDGHDRGARVVARLFRDEGFEVIYTGLRQSPAVIARTAIQEDADLVGLSIMSGAHLPLTELVMASLRAAGGRDVDVIVGGTVPEADVTELQRLGVTAVFGIGTNITDIQRWIAEYTQ